MDKRGAILISVFQSTGISKQQWFLLWTVGSKSSDAFDVFFSSEEYQFWYLHTIKTKMAVETNLLNVYL